FFFSSRRRHTRFSRDWSSDVCSSDLTGQLIRAFEEADPSQPLADHTKLWDLTLEAGVCKISRPKDNMEFQIYLPRSGAEILNERSEEHTSELQSRENLVCRLLLEKKK